MKIDGLDSNLGFDDYDDLAEDGGDGERGDEVPIGSSRQRARARAYRPNYEEPRRRPASERDTAFNALAWLLEGATGIMEEVRNNDLGLEEEFWVHASAARREGLLAMRALLDQMIEASEAQQTAEREREKRQERRGGINVDF